MSIRPSRCISLRNMITRQTMPTVWSPSVSHLTLIFPSSSIFSSTVLLFIFLYVCVTVISMHISFNPSICCTLSSCLWNSVRHNFPCSFYLALSICLFNWPPCRFTCSNGSFRILDTTKSSMWWFMVYLGQMVQIIAVKIPRKRDTGEKNPTLKKIKETQNHHVNPGKSNQKERRSSDTSHM